MTKRSTESSPSRHDPVAFIERVFEVGLRQFQRDWIAELFRETDGKRVYTRALWGQPRGNGKALALDTPIPTPDGWSEMGALDVGDEVFDDQGQVCRVVAATEVMADHDCFRVSFADGSSVVADAEHLWRLRDIYRAKRRSEDVTITTRELAEKHRINRPDGQRAHRYRLPPAAPLQTADVELPVDPYVFGAWLGDGSSSAGSLAFGESFVQEEIAARGYGLAPDTRRTGGVVVTRTVYGLQAKLRELGVLGKKHIPGQYLRGSYLQRLNLLQGLMDTDGTISTPQGQCSLTTVSMRLAADVLELVRSLGLKASIRERRAKIDGRDCGPAWVVQFHAYDDQPVFRMPRKYARQRPRPPTRRNISEARTIKDVQPVTSVPVRCIQVDSPSSLYLVGEGMVATHNSHLLAAIAGYMLLADKPRDGRPPQVVIAAGSWQQGMITFKRLREFIESSKLAPLVDVLSGRGFMRIKGGAELFVVSAEGPLQHGLEPTFVGFDEVWNQTKPDLYEALLGGMVKRPEPVMAMISTAGFDQTSLLWELCKEGERGDSPRFFYRWHSAPDEADWDDRETWKQANPAMSCEDPFLQPSDLEDSFSSMHENAFRRWHLNQWTSAEGTWMTADAWDACAAEPQIPDQAEVVVGIDASIRHDSTAVAIVRRDEDTYHVRWRVWTPPPEVQLENVLDYLRELSQRYRVKAFCYDPQYLHHTSQRLEDEGLEMVEWRQDNARMVPATRTLYEAISSGRVRHGADATARSHALNAGVKETERGLRIRKTASSGPDDCVIALAMAIEFASRREEPRQSVYQTRDLVIA